MVKVNDKVEFIHLSGIKLSGLPVNAERVVGTVVQVFPEHQWFSVEYVIGPKNTLLRTSFKFADIGNSVSICKRGRK